MRGSVQILEESVSVSFASKVDDVVQNTSLLLDEQLQQTQRLWETSSAILKSDIEVQFTNHSTKAQDLARQTFTAAISDMCAQSDKHFEAEKKFHALVATTNENHSTKILQMQETHLNQCMADLKRSQESELFSELSAEIHRANAIRDKTHAAAAAPPSPKVQADYETELKRKLSKNKLKARTRFRELEDKIARYGQRRRKRKRHRSSSESSKSSSESDNSCDKKRKSSAKKGAALQDQPSPKPATRALHLWGGDNVRAWLATEHVGLTVLEGHTFNGGLLRNGQALISVSLAQLTAAQVSSHDCDMFLACRGRLMEELAKLS